MKFTQKKLAVSISGLTLLAASSIVSQYAGAEVAPRYESPVHIFSIDDLQTDFQGRTYGDGGYESDPTAICGLGGVSCPPDINPATNLPYIAPFVDKEGVTLYPVDSEFGFHVVDFLGAQPKQRDDDYREGYVGNIPGGGVKISNAATDTFKVKPPLGTWCQGLGGTSVKCSTEHYSVIEHVLTCHEVIPYRFAEDDGTQAVLSFPDASQSYDCADAHLDDELLIYIDGEPVGGQLTDSTPGAQIDANDNTTVLDDIAASADYSVTLKDDGKALYRWGGLIKRPNDVRFYVRIPLPEEWKAPEADYEITSAKLEVTHWITNNPNDQLRPEDLENEAATGRKPSYRIEDGDWVSTKDCFEGDGDFIQTEEGEGEPSPLLEGTVFKNSAFSGGVLAGVSPPLLFSSDLVGGLTNAYYTTIDRDPFEWSYVDPEEAAGGVFEFVGSPLPLTPEELAASGLELVSGPRWRLKANKFGQDIPGLEIPVIECSPPPFGHDNIRYEVGQMVTTVINLLDWEEETTSPLASTKGWVDVTQNEFVTVVETPNGPVTSNGLPMTDDFDLAVYIKGDRKSTALISAKLIINEDEEEEPPVTYVSIDSFKTWLTISTDTVGKITLFATNSADNPEPASGTIVIDGSDGTHIEKGFWNLEPGVTRRVLRTDWTAPSTPQTVTWTATIYVDGIEQDQATAETIVF